MEEAANPRRSRGAALDALALEDLDLYSIEDLDERTSQLQAEIGRVASAKAKKLAGRAAADALFGGKD